MSMKLSDLNKKISFRQKVPGGSMASVERVSIEGRENECLLKTGYPSSEVYRAEAKGLTQLSLSKTFRVPEVYEVGDTFLLTEYIEIGEKSEVFWSHFAEQLVSLHRFSEQWFGFSADNYVGLSLQKNTPPIPCTTPDAWAHFFVNYRLGQQVHLAKANRKWSTELERAYNLAKPKIFSLLQEVSELPSLLHGDLWSGNYMVDSSGSPVLIDPATYFGHRETDLAMMRLFGGFPEEVFERYAEHFPLKSGWEKRQVAYQLYHQLNHLNLFGLSYEPASLESLQSIGGM